MRPTTTRERDIAAALIYSIVTRPLPSSLQDVDPATVYFNVRHLDDRWAVYANSRRVRVALGLRATQASLGPLLFGQAAEQAGGWAGHRATALDRVTAATGLSEAELSLLAEECGFETTAAVDPDEVIVRGATPPHVDRPLDEELQAFVEAHLDFSHDRRVLATEVYRRYRAVTPRDRAVKRSVLLAALDQRTTAALKKSGGTYYYRGLALIDNASPSSPTFSTNPRK